MNHSGKFVKLNKSIHDRASFDCGEAELNQFLQKYSSRHMEAGISTTRELPASKLSSNGRYPIFAFYTISPNSIKRESLPKPYKKNLPQYPIPVFQIAQMAVQSAYQGQGLGKITLVKALQYLWLIKNKYLNSYAVIVDCLNESVERFYTRYGFQVLEQDAGRNRLFLPMAILDSLFK